jgi:hypothetical protein
MNRSVSLDLDLEPGTYSVLMKITAERDSKAPTPEEVIREQCRDKPEKVIQIGLAYDLAHAKGTLRETAEEKRAKKEAEAKAAEALKEKQMAVIKEQKRKEYEYQKRLQARKRRQKARKEEHKRKKEPAAAAAAALANPATSFNDAQQEQDADQPDPKHGSTAPGADGLTPESAADMDEPEAAMVTPPAEPTNPVAAPKGKDGKDLTTQDHIDKFNRDLSSNLAVRTKAAAGTSKKGAAETAPPASVAPQDTFSDTSSLVSFVTSVDSLLDLPEAAVPLPTALPADPDSLSHPLDADDGEAESLCPAHLPDANGLPLVAATAAAAAVAAVVGGGAEEEQVDDENAEFANDPWNAVCVVGLRVFSKNKEGDVSVKVVRPKTWGLSREAARAAGEGKGKGKEGGGQGDGFGERELDLDDPSRGVMED